MSSGNAYKRALRADDVAALVEWFAESYDDGWRPTIVSHSTRVRGKLNAPWMAELRRTIARIDGEGDQK